MYSFPKNSDSTIGYILLMFICCVLGIIMLRYLYGVNSLYFNSHRNNTIETHQVLPQAIECTPVFATEIICVNSRERPRQNSIIPDIIPRLYP